MEHCTCGFAGLWHAVSKSTWATSTVESKPRSWQQTDPRITSGSRRFQRYHSPVGDAPRPRSEGAGFTQKPPDLGTPGVLTGPGTAVACRVALPWGYRHWLRQGLVHGRAQLDEPCALSLCQGQDCDKPQSLQPVLSVLSARRAFPEPEDGAACPGSCEDTLCLGP